jgi:hypothetical protein
MTPQKAEGHPGQQAYPFVIRLSPQFQFSLSPAALDMYLYGNNTVFFRPAISAFTRLFRGESLRTEAEFMNVQFC